MLVKRKSRIFPRKQESNYSGMMSNFSHSMHAMSPLPYILDNVTSLSQVPTTWSIADVRSDTALLEHIELVRFSVCLLFFDSPRFLSLRPATFISTLQTHNVRYPNPTTAQLL